MKIGAFILAACVLTAAAVATPPPPVPATPAAVDEIIYARPFVLTKGYEFEWRKERPLVTEGYVLVLKVNVDLVFPRQELEPVLYVGNQTAERVNVGHPSGYVVAIVPGHFDLGEAAMWFGTPELPERCDAQTIEAEEGKRKEANIKPFGRTGIDSALQKGGSRLDVADRYELRREAAKLIKQYSPQETELVEHLLMPRTP